MLLIDATNVGGGSCVLLKYLAKALNSRQIPHFILCSNRVDLSNSPHLSVQSTPPFSIRRQLLLNEYCKKLRPNHLFCFGNVPPKNRPKVKQVSTYFHNALLIGSLEPRGLDLLFRLRLWILRRSISVSKRNTDFWLFQTNYIANCFAKSFDVSSAKNIVLPFYEKGETAMPNPEPFDFDFIYSSSLAPHKNHINLFKAIEICALEGFYPTVAITVDVKRSSKLGKIVERCKDLGAKIFLTGSLDHSQSLSLLEKSKFVVFPSLIETLGLGLIEAALLGKPVICGNLPWIADVIEPSTTFDPHSPLSIADSMRSIHAAILPCPTTLVVQDRIDQLVDWLSS